MKTLLHIVALASCLMLASGLTGDCTAAPTPQLAAAQSIAQPTSVPPTATVTPPRPTDAPPTATVAATKPPATATPLPRQDLVYAEKDGRQKLDVYLPERKGGTLPTLLVIHGGNDRKESLIGWAKYFVERDYAVVAANIRGSRSDVYPAPTQDAFCALGWVYTNAAKYGFDTKRIGVVGHSLGGTQAAMLGIVDDAAKYLKDCSHKLPAANRVQAIVTLTGIFDYALAAEASAAMQAYVKSHLGGDSGEIPAIWKEASAITQLTGKEPPFLLIHGQADTSVLPNQSQNFAAALEKLGVKSKLILVPGASHMGIVNDKQSYQAAEEFLTPVLGKPSAVSSQPSIASIKASLQGLDFDAFLDQSYRSLILRSPEKITELGLADRFGMRNDQLDNLSDEYIRETQQLEAALLALLRAYDRSKLTPTQQLSFDIYAWYLEDQVRGHAFMYNDYPLSPVIISYHNELPQFFTDLHPVRNLREAQDYVARLAQVKRQSDQVLDGLKRRQAAGVILPKFYIPVVLRDLQNMARASARATPFYTAFQGKVNALKDVSDADKQNLLQAAEKEIEASVLPAFRALSEFLEQQQQIATNDAGVWKFSNGAEYYTNAVRYHTTTDLTAEQIHELGLREVARLQAEMRAAARELGYPANESIPQLVGRAARDSGTLQGEQIVKGYESLIQAAERDIASAFDRQPKAKVIVIGGPTGGYYIQAAMDGSRPGAFYAAAQGTQYKFSMPTLAYHEAVPGHHTQIAIAQELPLPFFRNDVGFNGYVEGWALYAEQLAWELGFYKNDPYGNIGRLQYELYRAGRLVVDTGINTKKWSYDKGINYLMEEAGLPRGQAESEVARYICWPAQATAYKIGMIRILELRQKAQERLGSRFDLKEFHGVVLNDGSTPLEILTRLVDDYIARKQ